MAVEVVGVGVLMTSFTKPTSDLLFQIGHSGTLGLMGFGSSTGLHSGRRFVTGTTNKPRIRFYGVRNKLT